MIFTTVVFAATLAAGATTVANTVLPQMGGDLSASLDQISWVVTAAVVAGAIGTPTTPWLAARFGAKQLLVVSIVAFTVASVMIGFSDSLEQVIAWRIAQALTGGPILALSQIFTLAVFTERERGRALAIWSMALTGGWVFAPVVGAYLAHHASWRLVFFAFAPMGLLAAVLAWRLMPNTRRDAELRFDWFGFFALSLALAGLQIVLNRGHRLDWFDSPQIVVWTGVAVIATYIFVVHSISASNPFFRWKVFADRNLSVGFVLIFAFAFISLIPLVFIPAMLEGLRGMEITTIGMILLPEGVVEILSYLLVARLVGRVDSRILISVGFLTFAAGAWMMTRYNLSVSAWDVFVPLALQGFAMTIIWLPVFHLMYSTIAESYRTEAAALIGLSYSISSSTGIALSVTLLGRSSQTVNEELAGRVTHGNEAFHMPDYSTLRLDVVDSLAAIQSEVAQQALMVGYVNVFWMLTLVCLAAVPVVLIFGSSGKIK